MQELCKDSTSLAQFIRTLTSVTHGKNVSQSLHDLQTWQTKLWQSLQSQSLAVNRFKAQSNLQLSTQGNIAQQISEVDTWLVQIQHDSQVAYNNLSSAQQLIQHFEQK